MGAGHLSFQLAQLLGGIALGVGQGLPSHIVLGHHGVVGLGHLDVVAKHTVILHLEVFNAGGFPLAGLQIHQPLLALGGRGTPFVELLAVAGPDDPAIGQVDRRFRVDGIFQQIGQLAQRVQQRGRGADAGGFHRVQQAEGIGHLAQRTQQRQTVAGVDRLIRNTRQQALHVIDQAQLLQQRLAQHRLLPQGAHGVQPLANAVDIKQRLLHPAAQQASAHGGCRLIKQPQQRAPGVLAAKALGQLQIAAGVHVKGHGITRRLHLKADNVLEVSHLGVHQVVQQSPRGRGRGLHGGIQPQRLQRAHLKVAQQTLPRAAQAEG